METKEFSYEVIPKHIYIASGGERGEWGQIKMDNPKGLSKCIQRGGGGIARALIVVLMSSIDMDKELDGD